MRGDPHVRFGGRAGETDRRRRRHRAPRPTLPIGQESFSLPRLVSWELPITGKEALGRCGDRALLRYRPGGRSEPESVVDLRRNRWPVSAGMGVRFAPEQVATFRRNTQSEVSGVSFGALAGYLTGLHSGVGLSVVKAIWPDLGYPLGSEFVDSMKNDFGPR